MTPATTNSGIAMMPAPEFRILRQTLNGGSNFDLLQQKFVPAFSDAPDVWRDVPIIPYAWLNGGRP